MRISLSCCMIALLLLTGCRANDEAIQQIVSQAHQQAKAKVEPLPNVDDFIADEFVMSRDRVPFLKPVPEHIDNEGSSNKSCWQPNLDRMKTPLETFPLEQLSMRGVLGDGNQLWALIYTPEGKLMKVTEGYYLGLNHGQITEVNARQVSVEEILPDGSGCWIKRTIPLLLARE